MVFYITFIEVDIGKPLAVEFVYEYCIKALARNEGFWHTSKQVPDVEDIWGVCENIETIRIDIFFLSF